MEQVLTIPRGQELEVKQVVVFNPSEKGITSCSSCPAATQFGKRCALQVTAVLGDGKVNLICQEGALHGNIQTQGMIYSDESCGVSVFLQAIKNGPVLARTHQINQGTQVEVADERDVDAFWKPFQER